MIGFGGIARLLLLIGVPVLVLLAVVITVSQFGGSRSGSSQGQTGGTVMWGVNEEPDTLDPHKMNLAVSSMILSYAGDPLISKDPEGNYVPGLAKSWEQSEDGLTWTFKLKEGVKFHDGTPLDADSVKASFERILDPKTKAGAAVSMVSQVESISAPAEYTLKIRLKEPYPVFLDYLTFSYLAPVKVEAAKEMGDEFGRKPVMTGPWKVASWESGEQVVLERNPDYDWGPSYVHEGPPHIRRLVFRIMPDNATRVSALQANEIQIISEVPPINVQQLREEDRYQLYSYQQLGLTAPLNFNVKKAPFDDPVVREAMSYAIDKDAIVEAALRNLGEPACGPLPPSIDGYWSGICDYVPGYDPERARQLLSDAGWEPGQGGTLTKNGEPFEFMAYTLPEDVYSQTAQLVQKQLEDIGVKMNIQTLELATLVSIVQEGKHQAAFLGWTYSNPDILYLLYHSSQIGSGLNLNHYNDPRLDAMLEDVRTETNEEVRTRLYRDIQKYIMDKRFVIPPMVSDVYIATQPQIKGAEVGKDGTLYLSDARVEE